MHWVHAAADLQAHDPGESKGSIYPILSAAVTQTKYRNRKELEESAVAEGWE